MKDRDKSKHRPRPLRHRFGFQGPCKPWNLSLESIGNLRGRTLRRIAVTVGAVDSERNRPEQPAALQLSN
jgi:hypothetical protein